MKITSLVSLTLLLTLALSSCSNLTPFTQRLYDENAWSKSELESIQFYVSEDLVLERQLRDGDTKITSGKIIMRDGRRIERVVIPKGTPGVLLDMPREDRFMIGFESNNDEAYIRFGPNPKTGNQYVVLAKDWSRGRGKVIYDGREFTIFSNDQAARLLVDLKKTKDRDVNSRVAKGRKID